jgi:uncharacterized SAM-binding protein YcdF (DUF218 family)
MIATLLFVASKLLWMLAAPSMVLLILAWAGLLLLLRRHRQAGFICLFASLGCFTAIALLPIGPFLLSPLENRFPTVTALPANVTGVIVLGGAVDPDISKVRGIPTLNDDAERMTSLVYLARQYPNARLAFTGGNGALVHGALAEADVARELFTELGVDQSRIVYESRSRNTYENAVLLKALVKPQPGQLWLLVTSAWHMPRSVGIFRRVGWQVLPYPVAYKTAPDLMSAIHGSFPGRLGLVDLATHEWFGLTAYWLLGRTSALFPAPQAVAE